jgi:tetratricopeptide (TPR) repeat protein
MAGQLWSLGQVAAAREQLRAAVGIEQRVRESGMIGSVLSLAAGYLARIDADAGDHAAAAAAVASNRRFAALVVRDVPAGAFGAAFLPEMMVYWGFPGNGLGYGAFAIPYAQGDYEMIRRLAHASAKRLEAINDVSPSQAQARTVALEVAYRTAADASYRLNDFAQADADIQRALALRKTIPTRTLGDQRDAGEQTAIAARITARLGRQAEAQQLIAPVLAMHRELFARKDNEDLYQHLQFADALYTSALAGSPGRTAELRQAAALIDALPAQMRELISTRRLRAWIAEAQAS